MSSVADNLPPEGDRAETSKPCSTCGFKARLGTVDLAELFEADPEVLAQSNAQEYAYKVHLQHLGKEEVTYTPLDELRRKYDVSPVLEQFGTWAVTEYGVECLVASYSIEKTRLSEDDWLEHMSEKVWVLLDDFNAALGAARGRFQGRRSRATR